MTTLTLTCSEQQIKQFAIDYLLAADPCIAEKLLGDRFEMFWEIAGYQSACDLELRLLLTQREGLKYLMNLDAALVDYTDTRSRSAIRGETSQRQDGWQQSQNTAQSTDFSDSIGKSRFEEFTNAAMDANSSRNAFSNSHDEASSCMSDTGHGEGVADAHAIRETTSYRIGIGSGLEHIEGANNGKRRGCNYQWSGGRAEGSTKGSSILGTGWSANHVGRKSGWTMYTKNITETNDKRDSAGVTERRSKETGNVVNRSERESGSYFNAHIDEGAHSEHLAHGEDHSSSLRNASTHAQSKGQGSTEAKSEAQSSNQATGQTHADGESHRLFERNSNRVLDAEKRHQRFVALKNIYDQIVTRVLHRRGEIRGATAPAMGYMTTTQILACMPRGWSTIPEPCYGATACGPSTTGCSTNMSHIYSTFGLGPNSLGAYNN